MSDPVLPSELRAFQAALADRYRIERELGAGGMATVYLVHDLRHDRRVALKVLHPELAAVIGAQRFLQEIRTTANLQHPHILGLIDSGETAHQLWYVMPFVEGESLRARIARERQLPVADAVRLASETASALDYAHRHGVIHRDIKPDNLLLHDGRVLVADFGIALAAAVAGGSRMTETGMSLGTPQYMSPEQAMGEREITGRSDIYSLGAVLYEMLIGEPPFTGPTAQSVVAQVVTGEPPSPASQRRSIPAHVDAAVLRALEKLPADRFDTAAAFGAALQDPAFAHARATSARWRRDGVARWLPWAVAAAALLALGTLAIARGRHPSSSAAGVQRLDMLLPDDARWVDEAGSGVAISPDGSVVAYTGQDSSAQRWIYLRSMDRPQPVRVPGSQSGANPFFSPDGRSLGFIAQGIMRVPLAGGTPERLCRVAGAGGYFNETWLENDAIVFADGTSAGLRQCSASGEATTLLASDSSETFNFPYALPGDRGLLLTIRRRGVERLAVLELPGKTLRRFDIAGSDPRYVATGHLVYASPDGVIRAVAFDARSLETHGEPVVIADGVRVGTGGKAMMAVSRTGMIVAAGAAATRRALELVDRTGRATLLYPRHGEFLDPRFSPDGRRIALSLGDDIWLLDRAQGALTRVSFDSAASRPVWSRDGRQLAYVRQLGARVDLRFINADGSATADSVLAMPGFGMWEALFAPDRVLLVRTTGGPTSRDIWRVPLDSTRTPRGFLRGPADEVSPAISPDGRWIAYASNETGRYEVYVRSYPDLGSRTLVSLDGGTGPVWSPRGNELFYRSGATLLAATVRTRPALEVLGRSILFTNGDYVNDPTHQNYDVAPDGAHFAMVRTVGGSSHLTVTMHLLDNLAAGAGASGAPRPR